MDNELIQSVIDIYELNHSIKETAQIMELSTVKVRKILITKGIWENETSCEIKQLLEKGLSTQEIAEKLFMSIKNVQAYMPYSKGLYGNNETSVDAMRSNRYRDRMKKAKELQINKERITKEGEDDMKNYLQFEQRFNQTVFNLHLELDIDHIDERSMNILKKYGRVEKSISRDILVPANMTLHALNYAILRSFGWLNGHLHNFSLPDEVYQYLTKNSFKEWAPLAGVYFRFPTNNYQDLYWDDDYCEGQSIKSWMRKKYTGPYCYDGFDEHYIVNQIQVKDLKKEYPILKPIGFDIQTMKMKKNYEVSLEKATMKELQYSFADLQFNELLERLPLSQLLTLDDNPSKKLNTYSETDIDEIIYEYDKQSFTSQINHHLFLNKYDPIVKPITKELIYNYDYGDDWTVKITLQEVFEKENSQWKNSQKQPTKYKKEMNQVIEKLCPVCVEKDGIELVDNVGGISGFCYMLEQIYDKQKQEEDSRFNKLSWAKMMGWTGRYISPEKTL